MYVVSFIVKLKIFKFVLYWFRIYEMTQHICGTFHQYSMCGCEIFKIFKFVLYWLSIYEIIHFWDFLGSYSPKHCLILLKLWPDVVSNKKNSFWKILQNLEFLLMQLKFTVLVHIGAQFTVGKPKILLKTKTSAKTASLGIISNVIPRCQKNTEFL